MLSIVVHEFFTLEACFLRIVVVLVYLCVRRYSFVV